VLRVAREELASVEIAREGMSFAPLEKRRAGDRSIFAGRAARSSAPFW
jgi:hypothetical protein